MIDSNQTSCTQRTSDKLHADLVSTVDRRPFSLHTMAPHIFHWCLNYFTGVQIVPFNNAQVVCRLPQSRKHQLTQLLEAPSGH